MNKSNIYANYLNKNPQVASALNVFSGKQTITGLKDRIALDKKHHYLSDAKFDTKALKGLKPEGVYNGSVKKGDVLGAPTMTRLQMKDNLRFAKTLPVNDYLKRKGAYKLFNSYGQRNRGLSHKHSFSTETNSFRVSNKTVIKRSTHSRNDSRNRKLVMKRNQGMER